MSEYLSAGIAKSRKDAAFRFSEMRRVDDRLETFKIFARRQEHSQSTQHGTLNHLRAMFFTDMKECNRKLRVVAFKTVEEIKDYVRDIGENRMLETKQLGLSPISSLRQQYLANLKVLVHLFRTNYDKIMSEVADAWQLSGPGEVIDRFHRLKAITTESMQDQETIEKQLKSLATKDVQMQRNHIHNKIVLINQLNELQMKLRDEKLEIVHLEETLNSKMSHWSSARLVMFRMISFIEEMNTRLMERRGMLDNQGKSIFEQLTQIEIEMKSLEQTLGDMQRRISNDSSKEGGKPRPRKRYGEDTKPPRRK